MQHFKIGLLVFLVFSFKAWSYPDFISYGYKSCLTCHYNGGGSGPLNDYGRALFASEFTANTFTSKTPDQLADASGFLGATELPWWIRPGMKYRGLFYEKNVGSSQKVDKWINMQGDLDLAFHLDQSNQLVYVFNFGYIPTPLAQSPTESKPANWISKSNYLRWQLQKGLMVYAGLFDKFFGIRHADHTAVNRSVIGLGQSDQSTGVALQYSQEQYEAVANLFFGNFNQDKEVRQVGASLMYEYYLDKTLTLGGSLLQSESDFKKEGRIALHSRLGFAKGKSFMFELGLFDNASKTTVDKSNQGSYAFLQGLIGLSKGYNFLTSFQFLKNDMKTSNGAESDRLGVGLLMFPFQKTEFRLEVVNNRQAAVASSADDTWNLQSQVHLSW